MNKSILNIHLDILDKKRQEVLQKLFFFTADFVLGGGTALSLFLSHRKSFDFDLFSQSSISQKLLENISQKVAVDHVIIDTSDELTFFTTDNIKITFLRYPFKPHFPPIRTKNNLMMFPVKEIALQKAYTIGRRGEYRDYFDLYTIFKNDYIDLDEVIDKAKQEYGSLFDEKLFLEQLVYFGDITNFEVIPVSNKPLPSLDEIKHYFEKLVKAYLASHF